MASMRGYTTVEHVPKSSFRDTSMCIIIPSRSPMLHTRFVQSLNAINWPMNGKRAMFFVTGAEVGAAYTEQVQAILEHPDLGKWKYLLTLEDDVLFPQDAVIRLLDSIELGPFDAVSGLYFTKSPDFPMPMMYGSPQEYARTGILDFRPIDPVPHLRAGNSVVEVNGIANGCSLFRMDVFRKIPAPWFVTSPNSTQDLAMSAKMRRAGMRLAVDTTVRCGHCDWSTNTVF